MKLLTGQFDYEEQGLFDRTHLRWFTPRTMAKALADSGLYLADVSPRPISIENAERFATALSPGLKAIGVDPADYLNRSGPLQFIWRATKTAKTRIVVNATMLAPQGGVSDVRIIEPMRALRTDTAVYAAVVHESEMTPPIQDAPRVAVLHRPLLAGQAGLARIRALLEKDYIIVSEFDDHPMFIEERGLPADQLLTFKAVHAVQTSTAALLEVLRLQNPEIALFRNGIFEMPPVNNFNGPEKLTMVFAALNRGEDWAPAMPVLNEVARAVGGRLHFQVLHDKDFFEALDTEHKTFMPMCDYATYIKVLGAADIAFMPLADTIFNRAKSDLKFIEAASCRVTALASHVVYADSITDGKTGLLFRNPMELRSALLRLLAYPEAARKMADAARMYVAKERMLAYQVGDRVAWYRSLWERRDALNEALKARIPALFA